MPDASNSDGPKYILDPSPSLDFTAILDRLTPEPPTGRPLTAGEIALASSVFGDSIDYTQVRIHHSSYLPLLSDTLRMTPNGQIYLPGSIYRDDFSTEPPSKLGEFLHEMTHVWQDQHDVNLGLEALKGWVGSGGDYNKLYAYQLQPGKNFEDYNIEQQGDIVEDYFFAANGIYKPGLAPLEAYRAVLPFDKQDGERVAPYADYAPANDGPESPADFGAQPESYSDPLEQRLPFPQPSPANPSAPDAGLNNPRTSTLPNAGPGDHEEPTVLEEDVISATPPQPGASPEPAAPRSEPNVEPPTNAAPEPAPQGPTMAELAGGDYVDPNEERAVTENSPPPSEEDLRAIYNPAPPEEEDGEEEDEQGTGGAGNEMPNPMDDGPSYTNADFSVLLNRNAPYVNPGPDIIDMPAGNIDYSVLLNRNAPYINPGPDIIDMPAGNIDYSVLLNRNAPYVNPGPDIIDMPAGDFDLSVLLNRNGPRMTPEPGGGTDLPGSTVDGLLSDIDFAPVLDNLEGFEIG